MSIPPATLEILINIEPFREALSKMTRALSKSIASFQALSATWAAHNERHHAKELPERSVLHAKYDQRRRARRRRRRT